MHRMLGKNDNLYDLSDGLEQYRGFVVSDINANENTISFTNGVVLGAGEATGDVNEIRAAPHPDPRGDQGAL